MKKLHRAGKSGELEVAIALAGRHVEVMFFQNVHGVKNPNGGRYDFDKLAAMPYLMRQRVKLELRKLAEVLLDTCEATLAPAELTLGPLGATALQVIEARNRDSWHYKPELGHADWHSNSNRESMDKLLLTHGAPVYLKDLKGRWVKGTAFYNLNNMWWVALSPHQVTNRPSWELRLTAPADLREKDNLDISQRSVERLLAAAVKAENFLRAAKLKDVRTALDARATKVAEAAAAVAIRGMRNPQATA